MHGLESSDKRERERGAEQTAEETTTPEKKVGEEEREKWESLFLLVVGRAQNNLTNHSPSELWAWGTSKIL